MVEFLEQYGPAILAMITAGASLAGSIYGIIKCFKTGKKVDANNEATKEDIQITKQGIVEAFKSAKIPNEWKISVSNQVNAILTSFRDEFITLIKENQAFSNDMLLMTLKILNFTAASSKLTEEEKAKIQDLINQIEDKDSTIDITEN